MIWFSVVGGVLSKFNSLKIKINYWNPNLPIPICKYGKCTAECKWLLVEPLANNKMLVVTIHKNLFETRGKLIFILQTKVQFREFFFFSRWIDIRHTMCLNAFLLFFFHIIFYENFQFCFYFFLYFKVFFLIFLLFIILLCPMSSASIRDYGFPWKNFIISVGQVLFHS